MKLEQGIHRYFIEFGAAMTSYVIVILTVTANRPFGGYGANWASIELLPIIPLLLAFWTIIRQYRRFDEYFQRVVSEAFALGAMIWGLVIMCWGFAENAGLVPLPTIFAAPGLIALWGLCMPFIIHRYR